MNNIKSDRTVIIGYLVIVFLSAAAALAAVSLYVVLRPMNFLESGYPVWKAKQSMLSQCDLGAVAVFGDSQSDSAVIPARLPTLSTNLGFAGGTPLENYFYVKDAISCTPNAGRMVLSFGPGAFETIQPWLWDNAVRYGLLGWSELLEIRRSATALAEEKYFSVKTHDGLNGSLRDIMYASHFPSIYFNSLIEGRVIQRGERNQARFDEVRAARGYPNYGSGAGVAPAVQLKAFTPLALQRHYFEKTVALLDKNGIEVDFLMTPMSGDRLQGNADAYLLAYVSYLQSLQSRYPKFHLLQDKVPVWPKSMFGDGMHLNQAGAEKFSEMFSRCLRQADIHATEIGARNPCQFALR